MPVVFCKVQHKPDGVLLSIVMIVCPILYCSLLTDWHIDLEMMNKSFPVGKLCSDADTVA